MEIPCDAIHYGICGIYQITNLINNKIYIGQSTDIRRRWLEHLRSGQPQKYSIKSERDINAPIHLAIQKYGVNNFIIEILEQCEKEQLNEKEKFWIQKKKANEKDVGYNITEGGQDLLVAKGENHTQAKLSQQNVNDIVQILQTDLEISLEEIAKKYNVTKSTICMINTGRTWKNDKLTYPLRPTYTGMKGSKNPKAIFTEEEVIQMRKLHSQGKTYKDLPDIYKNKASKSTIYAILQGKSFTHLPYWDKNSKKWIEPCIDYSQS